MGHWCPNQDCPALLPEQLKSFVGKRAMDIDGLGEHWCQELVDRGMATNAADLFQLTRRAAADAGPDGRKTGGPDSQEHRNQQGAALWNGSSTAWASSGWAGTSPRSWQPSTKQWKR